MAGDLETWVNVTRQFRLQRALLEDGEALSRSSRTKWTSAKLEEVRPVAEGIITDEGESDNLM